MRFRKIAVASTIIFLGLVAQAQAASKEAIVAAIRGSERHAQSLSGLTEEQQAETVCLALNLYHEARGSTERDILGVALVTRNRVEHRSSSFCSVIWERGQYSWTTRSVASLTPKEHPSWNRMVEYARTFVEGEGCEDFTNGANTFYSHKLGTPSWTARGTGRIRIGAHVYVRMPR